jgi:hypothetical protein
MFMEHRSETWDATLSCRTSPHPHHLSPSKCRDGRTTGNQDFAECFYTRKEPFALGKRLCRVWHPAKFTWQHICRQKDFAKCFLSGHSVKYFYILPSARQGTRQNICAVTPPDVTGYFASACPALGKMFFYFF